MIGTRFPSIFNLSTYPTLNRMSKYGGRWSRPGTWDSLGQLRPFVRSLLVPCLSFFLSLVRDFVVMVILMCVSERERKSKKGTEQRVCQGFLLEQGPPSRNEENVEGPLFKIPLNLHFPDEVMTLCCNWMGCNLECASRLLSIVMDLARNDLVIQFYSKGDPFQSQPTTMVHGITKFDTDTHSLTLALTFISSVQFSLGRGFVRRPASKIDEKKEGRRRTEKKAKFFAKKPPLLVIPWVRWCLLPGFAFSVLSLPSILVAKSKSALFLFGVARCGSEWSSGVRGFSGFGESPLLLNRCLLSLFLGPCLLFSVGVRNFSRTHAQGELKPKRVLVPSQIGCQIWDLVRLKWTIHEATHG